MFGFLDRKKGFDMCLRDISGQRIFIFNTVNFSEGYGYMILKRWALLHPWIYFMDHPWDFSLKRGHFLRVAK